MATATVRNAPSSELGRVDVIRAMAVFDLATSIPKFECGPPMDGQGTDAQEQVNALLTAIAVQFAADVDKQDELEGV